MNPKSTILLLVSLALLPACKEEAASRQVETRSRSVEGRLAFQEAATRFSRSGEIYNLEAPIPAQCYTDTQGEYNPCYVCHQTYEDGRPNSLGDGFHQGSYAFSEVGEKNHWTNLFVDRRPLIEKISDEHALSYVREDNYSQLLAWMKSDKWKGAILELKDLEKGAAAFDAQGLALDGSGWVAFSYRPFPSTFWPTNGSTDDTMIRLPAAFREKNGKFNKSVYFANLSLVELALSTEAEVPTIDLEENALAEDVNGDDVISSKITSIKSRSHFLGDASDVPVVSMLYPEGTEFLHTVRYIDFEGEGIRSAPRLKELRYMKKAKFLSPQRLKNRYYDEAKDKHFGKLPQSVNKGEMGTSNSFGWLLLGFIEDKKGKLRPQTPEEQKFCVGCHKSIGTTIDQTFSFPRKLRGREGWRYIDLKAMHDVPNRGESEGEILTYLKRVGGGDEFRQNDEMLERYFLADGTVNEKKVLGAAHLYELLTPSNERGMDLNKAYMTIVSEQSFIFGRDVNIAPARNVRKLVDTEVSPLSPEHRYSWDIRPAE